MHYFSYLGNIRNQKKSQYTIDILTFNQRVVGSNPAGLTIFSFAFMLAPHAALCAPTQQRPA